MYVNEVANGRRRCENVSRVVLHGRLEVRRGVDRPVRVKTPLNDISKEFGKSQNALPKFARVRLERYFRQLLAFVEVLPQVRVLKEAKENTIDCSVDIALSLRSDDLICKMGLSGRLPRLTRKEQERRERLRSRGRR